MAELSPKRAAIGGTVVAMAAASGGGDTVRPDPNTAVLITNGGGSPITVTVVVPGNTKFGQADPDVPVSIAAGATKLVGPFPQELADPTDGLVHITYSGVTTVTVAALAI